VTLPKGAVYFGYPFWVFGLMIDWNSCNTCVADIVDICNINDELLMYRSEARGNFLQLNLNIFCTQSIMLTTMLRKKILMIKELYKKENVCFCQSIFIQLVHVFNQMFVKKQIGSKLLQKLKSLRKYARAHSYWCTYMIKTQAAHQQFQSFVDTDLFEFILLLSFWIISEFHSLLHVVGKIC